MKNIVTNAAGISVLKPIEYDTYKTGGGPVAIGATVVQATRGQPGIVLNVKKANWDDVLGKPYSKKVGGVKMEGLRHINDALNDCPSVNVVRVLATDAEFPSITLTDDGETPAVVLDSHAFGTAMAVGTDEVLKIWVIDGDASKSRTLNIATHATKELLILTFTDVDENGDSYTLEKYTVSIDESATDDMGLPAYIETVLENNSDRFRADYDTTVSWASLSAALTSAWDAAKTFTGGTDGGEPTSQNWQDAWDLFRNESVDCNIMFAAGNVDGDVISNCIDIAEERHCIFLFDASPGIKHDAAITWLSGVGVDSRQCACYHAPFSASDEWYGGKTVWGVSGEMAASVARCYANYVGEIPGVHYAPAGDKRAKLQRTGIKALFADDIIDRDNLYTARINPIIAGTNGGAVCDDCLTVYYQENYSRFIWVTSIANYIDHRFVQAAKAAQFEPDGITYDILYRLTKAIMDDLVTSGALVPPRDDSYGTEPYRIVIEQLQIDLWQVTWEFCPTGAARRIVGQPRLIP